ncbi:hypothetical protein CDL15_Pgr012594 [Punica granatum]|nr:hypothetical protein CDL15_Pgr012594 [Punica granatum]
MASRDHAGDALSNNLKDFVRQIATVVVDDTLSLLACNGSLRLPLTTASSSTCHPTLIRALKSKHRASLKTVNLLFCPWGAFLARPTKIGRKRLRFYNWAWASHAIGSACTGRIQNLTRGKSLARRGYYLFPTTFRCCSSWGCSRILRHCCSFAGGPSVRIIDRRRRRAENTGQSSCLVGSGGVLVRTHPEEGDSARTRSPQRSQYGDNTPTDLIDGIRLPNLGKPIREPHAAEADHRRAAFHPIARVPIEKIVGRVAIGLPSAVGGGRSEKNTPDLLNYSQHEGGFGNSRKMSLRGRPRPHEGRPNQAPGLMRHGPAPILVPLSGNRPVERIGPPPPPLDLLENKVRAQEAEIERLVAENRRLASTQGTLREELVTAQQEAQRLKAHIKSIQTESDIQMRILRDKIAKYEVDIRAGEGVRIDLERAFKEAQDLVAIRQELLSRIQRANQELKMARTDAEKLQDLNAEFDSLMQEHNRLWATFEYEKSLNIDQVRQMQGMEQNLFSMGREVEKLRSEIMIAEKAAHDPNPHIGGSLNHPNPSYLPQVHGNGPYLDSLGRPLIPVGPLPVEDGTVPYQVRDGGVGLIPSSSSSAAWARPL